MFQGLSTGGEYVGAMTYIVEQAPDRKRGMVVGFLPLGNLAGFVAAGLIVTGLQTWLPSHDMLAWGWRVPLLLSAPLGLVAVFCGCDSRNRLPTRVRVRKRHPPTIRGNTGAPLPSSGNPC